MNTTYIAQLGIVAVVTAVLVVAVLAATGVIHVEGEDASTTPTAPSTDSQQPTENTWTPRDGGGNGLGAAERNGSLLPAFDAVYSGSCSDCHMGDGSLHDSPLHPIGLSKKTTSNWFLDNAKQAGPNGQLAAFQPSGIRVDGKQLYCSDCHTASSPKGLANPDISERTGDAHSVHQDVTGREGCIRCHSDNATAATGGVRSQIDMTRTWDEDLLSTEQETTDGGLARYLQAESPAVVQGSCGDCHGQYHRGNMDFSFTVESRVGPETTVSGGVGVAAGDVELECKACHVTDIHAVHTNGEISLRLDRESPEGLRGAESCLECHGVGVAESEEGHFTNSGSRKLGLFGPRDGKPDAAGYNRTSGDCGFCHELRP